MTLGSTAQDWYAAFKLGDGDKVMYFVDANGLALVSIQALHRQLQQLRGEVAKLRRRTD